MSCALYFIRLVVEAAGMGLSAFFRGKSNSHQPCAPYHGECFCIAKSCGMKAACFMPLVTVVGKDVG